MTVFCMSMASCSGWVIAEIKYAKITLIDFLNY